MFSCIPAPVGWTDEGSPTFGMHLFLLGFLSSAQPTDCHKRVRAGSAWATEKHSPRRRNGFSREPGEFAESFAARRPLLQATQTFCESLARGEGAGISCRLKPGGLWIPYLLLKKDYWVAPR